MKAIGRDIYKLKEVRRERRPLHPHSLTLSSTGCQIQYAPSNAVNFKTSPSGKMMREIGCYEDREHPMCRSLNSTRNMLTLRMRL